LIFINHREALSHPQKRTALFIGIVLTDDSQFFATALIDPNLPESLPRRLYDWRGASLLSLD
jgi:hypothetical protein